MSLPFDQQVTLTSKTYFPTFTGGSGVVSTFWSANDTWLQGGLSLPFDQQVTLNPNTCPNFRCGGVSALAENSFCSIQELSPPWQRTPSAAFEDVSTIWSASDTDFKNLSSNFHWWGLSPPFDQQVILTSKTYVWVSPHFDQGVSTFGCLFWSQCLHLLISKWHWLQKPKFQLSLVGGCLHLLTSSWHWLQTPKFRCPCLLIRVSPPLISKWHWLQIPTVWVSPPFDQGVFDFGFLHLFIRMSLPFDQQVTLTSKT